MTLLEALVALVVLGLSAAGFLDAFQGTSRSMRDAEAWVRAVGYAEAGMERTKLGAPAEDSLPPGFGREVRVEPWLDATGVRRVTVRVTFPGGGAFVLERLERAR